MYFIRGKHEHLCRWRPWQGTWSRGDPSVAGVKAGRVLCWGRRTEVGGGWSRQEAGAAAGAACERMCARVRELAGHVSPGDRDVWLSQPASQGAPGCQLTTARLQLGPNMKGKARDQTSNNASRTLFSVQRSTITSPHRSRLSGRVMACEIHADHWQLLAMFTVPNRLIA